MRPGKGFTLIEVLVVMVIIATLLSLVAPRYFETVERSKESTLKHDLIIMRDAIDKYYSDTGTYPDSMEDMVQRNPKKDGDPVKDANGRPIALTSHTLNPVPCIIGGKGLPDN
ncbi:MAG: prepilin-type N-terminal cleavage/methylation domain-containing protein, partial [Methylophilaceae bacterium]